MGILSRTSFTLKKDINGNGTFYTIGNNGFDEVYIEHVMISGEIRNLHIMVYEKWYANFQNHRVYTVQEFIEYYNNCKNNIDVNSQWDLDFVVGLKNIQGEFIRLSDNKYFNYPGVEFNGNNIAKWDYDKIPTFEITISYKTYKGEMVYF